MTGIIDVHTHILPGIDDGARDWDESRRMLETAYSQGIRHIVATPHYSRRGLRPEIYELSARLTEEAKKIAPDFKTGLGQETYYHEGLVENLKQGQALTLEGTRCVLVEFDPQEAYHSLYQAVRKMTMARYIPVIAHVERYFCLREASDELQQPGGEWYMEPGGAVVPQAGPGRKDSYTGHGHAQDGLQEAGCPGKPWMAGKTCGGTGIKSPG